ncbi:hypothetical protein O181_008680 [Austropuccinia psidii MF-1]|uniref:Uncharacterized protein n=1 Tax=Austropuccinia psidii MF-1 TaxID=1389203 RepID=A0A9Q3BPU5_9BASI|nr:hypothetical protein [Austropuccinia psidii MF-1]
MASRMTILHWILASSGRTQKALFVTYQLVVSFSKTQVEKSISKADVPFKTCAHRTGSLDLCCAPNLNGRVEHPYYNLDIIRSSSSRFGSQPANSSLQALIIRSTISDLNLFNWLHTKMNFKIFLLCVALWGSAQVNSKPVPQVSSAFQTDSVADFLSAASSMGSPQEPSGDEPLL